VGSEMCIRDSPRALARVGVSDTTDQFVLVTERPRPVPPLLEALRLTEDPSAYPRSVTAEQLERLGVGAVERTVVPQAGWEGLVLERVALLDLEAPKHSEPISKQKA